MSSSHRSSSPIPRVQTHKMRRLSKTKWRQLGRTDAQSSNESASTKTHQRTEEPQYTKIKQDGAALTVTALPNQTKETRDKQKYTSQQNNRIMESQTANNMNLAQGAAQKNKKKRYNYSLTWQLLRSKSSLYLNSPAHKCRHKDSKRAASTKAQLNQNRNVNHSSVVNANNSDTSHKCSMLTKYLSCAPS